MDLSHLPFTEPTQPIDQNSIFKSLLTQIEMQVTSPQRKSTSFGSIDCMINPYQPYAIEQQVYEPQHKKSISEWVWTDQVNESIGDVKQNNEEITEETAQLKRVQSMRMEQEMKLTQIMRLDNLMSGEEPYSSYDVEKTMNLSPRKKKRIDKEKIHQQQQVFLWPQNRKPRTHSMSQLE